MKEEFKGKYISCVGDTSVDMILPYADFKAYKERVAAGFVPDGPAPKAFLRAGGTSANTATLLAKLRIPTILASKVSSETFGRYLYDDICSYNICTDYLKVQGTDSVMIMTVLDSDDRVFLKWTDPKVVREIFSLGDLPDDLAFKSAAVHFCGGNVICDNQQGPEQVRFAERCKELGVPVSLDLNLRISSYGMSEQRKELINRIVAAADIVFGSEFEEFSIFSDADDLDTAVENFVKLHPGKIVVARNGAEPVALCYNGTKQYFSPPAVEVVNTVGAGDAFNAGFLSAFYNGTSLEECVMHGNAIAAYLISHEEHRSTPTEQELAELISSQKANLQTL